MDVEKDKLPFADESVDFILVKSVMEHFSDIVHFMKECHRVLVRGGEMKIIVMYCRNPLTYQPMHKLHYNITSFDYWTDVFSKYPRPCRFEQVSMKFLGIGKIMNWVAKQNVWLYQNIFSVFFPARQIEFVLKKI